MASLEKLEARVHTARAKLHTQFPKAHKKLESLGLNLKDIRRHSAKILSMAALLGGLILTSPLIKSTFHPHSSHQTSNHVDQVAHRLREQLMLILPKTRSQLNPAEENHVSQAIEEVLGIKAVAQLDGHRLNSSIGRIGGEQHLPRFPGDSLSAHDELQVKGITSSRGAFGYFARDKASLTPENELQEKYYVAVQTLYLPNWNTDYKTLKEWYKFRKVLVVNPTTGKSVVAVIGDAGPAAWTGKQFGGSPEVMDYLQPYKDKNNGTVLLFFIDDERNTIALGPVQQGPTYLAAR